MAICIIESAILSIITYFKHVLIRNKIPLISLEHKNIKYMMLANDKRTLLNIDYLSVIFTFVIGDQHVLNMSLLQAIDM